MASPPPRFVIRDPPTDCLLLESYLTNRIQSTFVNGCTSEESEISYGVPQGSVLWPKLFIVFVNDLVLNIQHCKCFPYTDDKVLFKSLKKDSRDAGSDLFRQDIASIEHWCRQNKRTINIKKTKLQFFPVTCNTEF